MEFFYFWFSCSAVAWILAIFFDEDLNEGIKQYRSWTIKDIALGIGMSCIESTLGPLFLFVVIMTCAEVFFKSKKVKRFIDYKPFDNRK